MSDSISLPAGLSISHHLPAYVVVDAVGPLALVLEVGDRAHVLEPFEGGSCTEVPISELAETLRSWQLCRVGRDPASAEFVTGDGGELLEVHATLPDGRVGVLDLREPGRSDVIERPELGNHCSRRAAEQC